METSEDESTDADLPMNRMTLMSRGGRSVAAATEVVCGSKSTSANISRSGAHLSNGVNQLQMQDALAELQEERRQSIRWRKEPVLKVNAHILLHH